MIPAGAVRVKNSNNAMERSARKRMQQLYEIKEQLEKLRQTLKNIGGSL